MAVVGLTRLYRMARPLTRHMASFYDDRFLDYAAKVREWWWLFGRVLQP